MEDEDKNPKPYFGTFYKRWIIAKECVKPMREAFNNGTQFIIDSQSWNSMCTTGERFEGWCLNTSFISGSYNYIIRVSNDERRRLLPILDRLILLIP
jgi:hypothetical protein